MNDAAGSTLSTSDGRKVVLGALIKSGGAGSVYRMRDLPTQVAKLYHPGADLRMYERRIAAMLELEPQLPELVQDGMRYVQLAWPDAGLRDARGRFVGYLMPVVDIDATNELEFVLQERQARRMNLPTGLGAKVTLAANLCAVIAALHRQRHYVVDLKPVNLRFYRQSLYMAMLDCDGFSIQGRGERFEAPQYTPEYLAPEFHARGLTVAGEAQQDRFALAVVVFQLLNFGIHPFTGRPQSNQVPTDVPARIAGRFYAHGIKPHPALLPTPSSGHAAMPAELRTLFDRAFDNTGATRPSADEWSDVLRGYAQRAAGKLVACKREAAHQHFAGHDCAACARAQTLAGAQAAVARRPPRPPTPRQGAFARAVGGFKPKPAPAPVAPAGPSRIPPNILAKINQAWARRTPPPVRPANWPAPSVPAYAPPPVATPPPPRKRRPANWPVSQPVFTPAPSGTTTKFDLWAILIVGAFMLVSALGNMAWQSYDDWRRETRYIAEAPQRLAEAKARQEAERLARAQAAAALLQPAAPGWGDLDEQARQIDLITTTIAEGNDYAVLRGLATLRSRSRTRQEQWRQRLEQARRFGESVDNAPPPTAVVDTGIARQREGWDALTAGNTAAARKHFAAALWADADNAGHWFGYGLSSTVGKEAVGALAIGILLYPDAASARAMRARYVPAIANGDVRRKAELDDLLDRAGVAAERLRTRLPAGTVRLSEPFSWKQP